MGYLKIYFGFVGLLLSIVGSINLAIDPLWYGKGNKLTKVNSIFNERLTKTNLLLNSDKEYDCLILGSSRLTLLDNKSLKKNTCFNYSFSAGTAEEFIVYGEYVKSIGIYPKKVYVGIDGFNFIPSNIKATPFKRNVEIKKPVPLYQPYFLSLDTLRFSLRIIRGELPDSRFYDQNFQGKVFAHIPKYKPKFSNKKTNEKCNFSRTVYYKQIRGIFPDAEIVGYISPVSVWTTFNDIYARGVLNCQLQGIYEAAKSFDITYDFSLPSEITTRTDNTYDGSHYYPRVHDEIATFLEGKNLDPAIDSGIIVNQLSLDEYQQLHRNKLKEFLEREGEGHRWSD